MHIQNLQHPQHTGLNWSVSMKKLLFLLLLLSTFSNVLFAQKLSVSILTGPSTIYYWSDDVDQAKVKSPIGYDFGINLARNINPHWQFKLGVRYCLWKVPDLIGPLQWPSEHDGNGGYQYDPSIAHYLTSSFTQQKAFQYLTGFRWQNKSEELHWVADGEFGFTSFTKNKAGISTHLQPTVGLAFGAEIMLRPKLFLFAHPGARVVFRNIKQELVPVKQLLNLHVEMGGRYTF
jgi:hypothetical protein